MIRAIRVIKYNLKDSGVCGPSKLVKEIERVLFFPGGLRKDFVGCSPG
jgi:hypothetical protein